MKQRKCMVPACGRPYYAKDLCTTHYYSMRAGRSLEPIRERRPKGAPIPRCALAGCGLPRDTKGLCKGHYDQQRNLERKPVRTNMTTAGICETPDAERKRTDGFCGRPIYAKGVCKKHYIKALSASKPPCAFPECGRPCYRKRDLCQWHSIQSIDGRDLKPIGKGHPSGIQDETRLVAMYRMRRDGASLEAIGQAHNLTRERVRQLLKKAVAEGLTDRERFPKKPRVCSVEGCGSTKNAGRGMCSLHYGRLKKGTPVDGPARRTSYNQTYEERLEAMFLSSIREDGDHQVWTGVMRGTVPVINVRWQYKGEKRNGDKGARRYAWQRRYNQKAPGHLSAGCGVTLCVRPEHLVRYVPFHKERQPIVPPPELAVLTGVDAILCMQMAGCD